MEKEKIKTIEEIIEEYNKNKDPEEVKITLKTIENARKFEELLLENKITGYDIVPSPLGTIYFEWTENAYSMGVSIDSSDILTFEHLIKKPLESFIEVYSAIDDQEMFELLRLIKDVITSGAN